MSDQESIKVYLGLGSNIGEPVENLIKAIDILTKRPELESVKSSSFYGTAPRDYIDQDRFVNCVVECYTSLNPVELLKITQGVEKELKRVKLFRWGPRIIDVDILLYGDLEMDSPDLTIPHPRMYERAFVLVPLSEFDNSFKDFAEKVADQDVKLLNSQER